MFPAVATQTRTTQRNLYLVWSRTEAQGIAKGEMKMNNYRFAAYPSNSSVAAGVTVLVSAWFLIAVLRSSPTPLRPIRARWSVPHRRRRWPRVETPSVSGTIYVSARTPQVFDTIYVSAKRTAT